MFYGPLCRVLYLRHSSSLHQAKGLNWSTPYMLKLIGKEVIEDHKVLAAHHFSGACLAVLTLLETGSTSQQLWGLECEVRKQLVLNNIMECDIERASALRFLETQKQPHPWNGKWRGEQQSLIEVVWRTIVCDWVFFPYLVVLRIY